MQLPRSTGSVFPAMSQRHPAASGLAGHGSSTALPRRDPSGLEARNKVNLPAKAAMMSFNQRSRSLAASDVAPEPSLAHLNADTKGDFLELTLAAAAQVLDCAEKPCSEPLMRCLHAARLLIEDAARQPLPPPEQRCCQRQPQPRPSPP